MKAFIKEIAEVCRKHKLTISHEDQHGAFLIEDGDATDEEGPLYWAVDKTQGRDGSPD